MQCRPNIRIGLAIRMTIGLLGMLFWTPACEEAPSAPRPVLVVGEWFEYTNGRLGIPCNTWQTAVVDSDGYFIVQCGDFSLYVLLENLNAVRVTDKTGTPVVEFLPYLPAASFPLQVGKHYGGAYTGFTAANNARWTGEMSCVVAAQEDITVKAGTFTTFRVECTDKVQAPSFHGENQTTYWYAPQAKNVVKVVSLPDPRFNTELVSYSVQ